MSAEQLRPGWRKVRFGDVVRQVKDKVEPETAGIERYVAGEHMDTDDLRVRRWGQVGDGYLGPAFTMRFKPGQVLYGSRRTYLRKVALADFEGICANTTFVVESATDDLLPDFLPYVMTAEAFHDHSIKQSKGSVNPYINFSDLKWYEFALPPLDEQMRIVEVLDAAQVAVQHSLNVQDAAKAAERALFAAVLGWDHNSFTVLGDAPLITKPLAEVAVLRRGRFSHRPRNEPRLYAPVSPFPFVQTGDVERADEVIGTFSQYLSPEGVSYSRSVPPGTLLVTIAAVIGATARTSVETFLPDSIVSVEEVPGVSDAEFLELLIRGLRPHLEAVVATENTQKNLSIEKLGAVRVPLPDLPLQARIVTEWDALRSVLRCAAASSAAAGLLLRSLRERLLGAPQ